MMPRTARALPRQSDLSSEVVSMTGLSCAVGNRRNRPSSSPGFELLKSQGGQAQ